MVGWLSKESRGLRGRPLEGSGGREAKAQTKGVEPLRKRLEEVPDYRRWGKAREKSRIPYCLCLLTPEDRSLFFSGIPICSTPSIVQITCEARYKSMLTCPILPPRSPNGKVSLQQDSAMGLVPRVRAGGRYGGLREDLRAPQLGSTYHPYALLLESCTESHSHVLKIKTGETEHKLSSTGARFRRPGLALVPPLTGQDTEQGASPFWTSVCLCVE